MRTLILIALLVPVSSLYATDRRTEDFKARVHDPLKDSMRILWQQVSDAVGLAPPQKEELRKLMRKYMKQLGEIEQEVKARVKPPYPVDPMTGRPRNRNRKESAQMDAFFREFAKESKPVIDAWRKEMASILSRKQVIRMNELKWNAIGVRLLYRPQFQQFLQMTPEQVARIKELCDSTARTPKELQHLGGRIHGNDPISVAQRMEVQEKMLQLLTPKQIEELRMLLGGQTPVADGR